MTTDDPEHPVRMQLEAYNARDLEGFLRWWAEDCEVLDFPDRPVLRGKAALRARHAARFAEPWLRGALMLRTSAGNLVVDREVVTRSYPDGPGQVPGQVPEQVDVIAIYEVAGGLIARAWFHSGPRHAPPAFRPAGEGDVEAIRALVREAYARWVPVIGREPLPMRADYARAVAEHQFELAHRGGEILGLVETVPHPDHLWVENLAVRPGRQGAGLGGTLLARAEARARAAGLAEARLLTNAAFAANLALYARLGYAETRREPFAGGVTVHMTKPLR